MKIKLALKAFFSITTIFIFSTCAYSTDLYTTPSAYNVTIMQIQFVKDDGTLVKLNSSPVTMDIASVNPGAAISNVNVTSNRFIPPGNYTGIRVIIRGTLNVTGSTYKHQMGQLFPCATSTANNGNTRALNVDQKIGDDIENVSLGSYGVGLVPTPQNISMPTDIGNKQLVANELAANSITPVGNDRYLFVSNQNFTIPDAQVLPNIRIDFDVTDTLIFSVDETSDEEKIGEGDIEVGEQQRLQCVIRPVAPTITVTIS